MLSIRLNQRLLFDFQSKLHRFYPLFKTNQRLHTFTKSFQSFSEYSINYNRFYQENNSKSLPISTSSIYNQISLQFQLKSNLSTINQHIQSYSTLNLHFNSQNPIQTGKRHFLSLESISHCWNCKQSIHTTSSTHKKHSDLKNQHLNENEHKNHLICSNCQHLIPASSSMDYFTLFNCLQKYEIDEKKLDKRYIQLQRLLHPDKFHTKSDIEKKLSLENSILVTEAYRTLKDPVLRAKYLLRINGIEYDEDAKETDREFLIEIMEKREQLLEKNDEKTLRTMFDQNKQLISVVFDRLKVAFELNDFENVRSLLSKLVFYVRLSEEIHQQLPIQ